MKTFWQPNLPRAGRTARAILGGLLLVAAAAAFFWHLWAGLILLASAVFVLVEAARGWCLLRACGIKTRL